MTEGGEPSSPPSFPMITYHLNEAQKQFIKKWAEEHKSRPPFGVYDKALRDIGKLKTAARPPVKSIPSTKPGFHSNEFVPTSRFNAVKHLPPGWAAFNCHDSGGNHRLLNAGQAMLTALWNYWSGHPADPIEPGIGVFGERLQKQLKANDIAL